MGALRLRKAWSIFAICLTPKACLLSVKLTIRPLLVTGNRPLGQFLFLLGLGSCLAASLPASAQAPPAPTGPSARFVVVLDAAHGGDDAGAQLANGRQEKL